MTQKRATNTQLAALIAEAGMSHGQVARAIVRIAQEVDAYELFGVGRSHVSHWIAGTQPSGRGPMILREALSRQLGRSVALAELGLTNKSSRQTAPVEAEWHVDTLSALTDLGRDDVELERRRVLEAAVYSVAALALPDAGWWRTMTEQGDKRSLPGTRRVRRSDVDAVRDMTSMFSRVDQRRGGGHARTAVAQYLTADVARYLRGSFTDDQIRRDMFSTAGELAYLAGWMAFDNSEHATAQRYFISAVKLAAEADDPPLAGHILRAMSHQAIDLGHSNEAVKLAEASIADRRYALASPRERALLGVVRARSLALTGDSKSSAAALLHAEDDLRRAEAGDGEPHRVFFFGEASLAHETACALRDSGDMAAASREFRRSVRTRKAITFTRTHAVTLGYLGAVQMQEGNIEQACTTWSTALDAMDGVRSGRTRQVTTEMRALLAPFKRRGISAVTELDARAAAYLTGVA
jgi:hypothetical protein